ncbi:hybrid sensor histidine kinase/response regulator transcription factor [Sediminitomix flava]|uniref:histidine kinase n=1 Tax=Sediminitomix flava TaxID=379075 RepID=A0A315Z598_SEDFL|nr:two-component regulator propeller domain-containing protein [Sediminitomix flava]PWJ37995.1 signal transduction histidine kinase [Sediminitomix flava]
MKQLLTFVFALLSFLSFGEGEHKPVYKVDNYNLRQGVLHTDVQSILQDSVGYIWLGTRSGLQKYDGYQFHNYHIEYGKNNKGHVNRIVQLVHGKGRYIWVLTEGGIFHFNKESERFTKLNFPQGTNLITPKKMLEVNDKELLVYGQSYLVRVELGKDIETVNSVQQLGKVSVMGFASDGANNTFALCTNGVWRYRNGEIKRINIGRHTMNPFHSAYINKSEGIYLGGRGQILHIPKEKIEDMNWESALTHYDISDELPKGAGVLAIHKDYLGQLWVGTHQGLMMYTSKMSQPVRYSKQSTKAYWPSTQTISSLLEDRTGGLWVGTSGGGVNFIDLTQKKFEVLPKAVTDIIGGKNYRALLFDDQQNLWIGSSDGIYVVNTKTNKVVSYKNDPNNPYSLCFNNIRSLLKDKKGRIWVGTDNGLSVFLGNGKFFNITSSGMDKRSLTHTQIYEITEDIYGFIWAGSWTFGLNRIRFNSEKDYEIAHFYAGQEMSNGLTSNMITDVYADKHEPILYVGTKNGANRIILDQVGNFKNVQHIKTDNSGNSINSDFIMTLKPDNRDNLWVGTIGGGLNKVHFSELGYTVKHFTDEEGLSSNDIESIEFDAQDRLWLGGRGISLFDPKTEKVINYSTIDGLSINTFKPHVVCKGPKSSLWFGGVNGINYFYPAQIKNNDFKPNVGITSIQVNNKRIVPGVQLGGEEVLDKSILYSNRIELPSHGNSLEFTLSGFHFANSEKLIYAYKIKGIDSAWNYTDKPEIQYTELQSGTYNLKVKSSNGEEKWSDVNKLEIVILPPWYKSVIAKRVYIIIGILLLILSYYSLLKWQQEKKLSDMEKMEYEQSERMHEMQLEFFTNVSHEFRTPLALILANLHKLKGYINVEDSSMESRLVNRIEESSMQLDKLINELLDFRKLETGHFKLKVSKVDLPTFSEKFIAQCQALAEKKNIKVSSFNNLNDPYVWCDAKVLEKIIHNIISNAIKYTTKGGELEFECSHLEVAPESVYEHRFVINENSEGEDLFWIRVKDNGMGIKKDLLPNIFDRYFRGKDDQNDNVGYGIGLGLVKNLVHLHRGEIHIFSEEGKGTEVFIGLPSNADEYIDTDSVVEDSLTFQANYGYEEAYEEVEEVKEKENSTSEETKKNCIALVEDNPRMLEFLAEHFSEKYKVVTAQNGLEGLEVIKANCPDMILSDIMMPKMDGLSMIEKMKEDNIATDVPIVLLTAKDNVQDKLRAAKLGVDTFFNKPFDVGLVDVKVEQILERRSRLKEKYQTDMFADTKELADNRRDQEFIDMFTKVIEENISDVELDVTFICRTLGYSRSNLYKKVKQTTGCSINQFIRQAKFKKAVMLLASENLSIQEVMEKVGFQSPSYFTRAFKKEFGVTPSKYIKMNGKTLKEEAMKAQEVEEELSV